MHKLKLDLWLAVCWPAEFGAHIDLCVLRNNTLLYICCCEVTNIVFGCRFKV